MTYRQLLTDLSLAALLAAPTLTLTRPAPADQTDAAAASVPVSVASDARRGPAFLS